MAIYFESLVRHNFRNGLMYVFFETRKNTNQIKGNYYGKHKIQI